MATLLKPATEHASPSKDVFSEVSEFFMPKDTLDQPCDVVLVVKDGKKFKAHRQVLSEASPFFEKLLNNDMKESKEGIVRLETFSESVVGNTLTFIYTGNVHVLTEDNSRDLIVMADYLFVENLKNLAKEVLVQKLNTSNCISIHYFSERYQCTELFFNATKFILANFSVVYAASQEEILNMSSKEIQMWISSDEINVTVEEDVFNIILAWIDHDKRKRKKYFPELFRQVRLVYVSRDFLCSNISTNDLVNDNEDRLALVEEAMRLIESRNYDNLPVTPRKCLLVPVIVACSPYKGHPIHCYFPREDRCGTLGEMPFHFLNSHLIPCHGKIYGLRPGSSFDRCQMASFAPYTNNWMPLQCKEDRILKQIFVVNENEMYALVSEACATCHTTRRVQRVTEEEGGQFFYEWSCRKEKHISFITKYKPESNSWEDISSFDHMHLRENVCIVAKDNFVYFIGGAECCCCAECCNRDSRYNYLTDVERYDLRKNQWDKVADIHIDARNHITSAAAHEKIFIAGGRFCEVFIETTNEWQFVSTPYSFYPQSERKLLSIDDRLYILAKVEIFKVHEGKIQHRIEVKCYDPDKNEWSHKTEINVTKVDFFYDNRTYCSIHLFKGFLNNEPEKEDKRETPILRAACLRCAYKQRIQNRRK
ncbi:kelch-like protein 28 [Oculina patagonica]